MEALLMKLKVIEKKCEHMHFNHNWILSFEAHMQATKPYVFAISFLYWDQVDILPQIILPAES